MTSPFTSSLISSSLLSSCSSFCPTTSSSRMWWKHPLCDSAEELAPLAYVEYTQESLSEQRFPEDFDYDDITIGQTLLNACGRRADHSEEEGLSSCLSSSSMSHDRTGKHVVCRDISHEQGQEIQRQNSESEQISPGSTKGANPH